MCVRTLLQTKSTSGTNNHWNQFWIVRICTVSHVKRWFYLEVQSGASMRNINPPVLHRTLQKIKTKQKLLGKMCTFLQGTFKLAHSQMN